MLLQRMGLLLVSLSYSFFGATLLADTPLVYKRHPNIIVVFIDDMGWGDLSCFGNQSTKTPNIDRLAGEGIRFSQFYVNSPICSPSRCAISTGQYPQRWRITSYLNNRADNDRRGVAHWLNPDAPMLARFLHDAGYATGHFGKWHLGGQRDVDDAPEIGRYGFDQSLTNFEGMGSKLLPLTLKPGDTKTGKIWEDAERLGAPVRWMQRSQITTGFVDAAIPFMDAANQAGKPFYINLWPDDVHSPWWPPVEKWPAQDKGAVEKRAMYLVVLEEMDRQLGKLFDHLCTDPSLQRNTVVLVCSDNGPEHGAGSAGPFRGAKTTLFEGGIRSPLIVWSPGLMDRDRFGFHNETSVFSAIDLVPSLLRIASVTATESVHFDGEDLSKVLLGEATTSRSAPICWRRPPDRPTWSPSEGVIEQLPDLAIRDGNWKLLCNDDGSRVMLYNLAKDRAEVTNLAIDHGDVVDRLRKQILEWHHSMPPDNGAAIASESASSKLSQQQKQKTRKANRNAKPSIVE